MKTILIDALSALRGGGQTYLRNLFGHYRPGPDVRVLVLAPWQHANQLAGNGGIDIIAPRFPSRGLAERTLWLHTVLPRLLRQCRADVLFCPGGYLSTTDVGRCRTAITFQNMLPFVRSERQRYPLGYTRLRLKTLETLQKRSVREADLVICISNHGCRQVETVVPLRKGRLQVIPHGLDTALVAAGRESARPISQEYVLYVSILDVYKAQIEVVQAWSMLRRQRETREKLVLLGPEFVPYARKVRTLIDSLGLRDEVLLTGALPYSAVAGYYQHAKINLFASSCENCPFILLEAMSAGRPVLSSSYPPMPEIAASAADYFDPYRPDQLAGLLHRYLDDSRLRAEMGQRALARSGDFDWSVSATRTWDALFSLAAGDGTGADVRLTATRGDVAAGNASREMALRTRTQLA